MMPQLTSVVPPCCVKSLSRETSTTMPSVGARARSALAGVMRAHAYRETMGDKRGQKPREVARLQHEHEKRDAKQELRARVEAMERGGAGNVAAKREGAAHRSPPLILGGGRYLRGAPAPRQAARSDASASGV